jgi:hypothetical protein
VVDAVDSFYVVPAGVPHGDSAEIFGPVPTWVCGPIPTYESASVSNPLWEVSVTESSTPGPPLTLRAVVILLIAVVVGIGAGVLAYLDGSSPAGAVLVGGGAAGAAAGLAHRLIQ